VSLDLPERVLFGGLDIVFDARVLRPRPWTVAQAQWAAELLTQLPPGPVLELCCGAGQIGLAAVHRARRELVCIDVNPIAAVYTSINAQLARLGAEVDARVGRIEDVLLDEERFPLIIADPPWVSTAETGRYPDDPIVAIDGGTDGLSIAQESLRAIERHLSEAGLALIQLGSVAQVDALMSVGSGSLRFLEVRSYDGGVVAKLGRTSHT
jgi:methylase of polypeptide subunit release factors